MMLGDCRRSTSDEVVPDKLRTFFRLLCLNWFIRVQSKDPYLGIASNLREHDVPPPAPCHAARRILLYNLTRFQSFTPHYWQCVFESGTVFPQG